MALCATAAGVIRGVVSSVPERLFDNRRDTTAFAPDEVDKVVKMAGVQTRHLASERLCSSDLCVAAARRLLQRLDWAPESVDALIFVTQSQDYFLPSTSCLVHHWLGLSDHCAAFDVGQGCSGYPYGLWLAAMMLGTGGVRRALVLHGETPGRFADRSDRAVALLFGDAGSATAIERPAEADGEQWWFSVHTDGSGWRDLIIEGGGFRDRFPADPQKHTVSMNGPGIFNFAIRRVPAVIDETLRGAGVAPESVDYFILHQSNLFIMRHLAKKLQIPAEKLPLTIQEYGSAGGPSVPLTIVKGDLVRPQDRSLRLLLVGYGVGLSWGSALVTLPPEAVLDHVVVPEPA